MKLSPPPCPWVLVGSCKTNRQRAPSLLFLAIDKHNKQRKKKFRKSYLKFEAYACIPHLFLAPRNRPQKQSFKTKKHKQQKIGKTKLMECWWWVP